MRLEFSSNNPSVNLVESEYAVNPEQYSTEVAELIRSGIEAARAGNRVEARYLLLRATDLSPHHENAWLWLASISEYPEELLVFLKHVLSINPDNQRALEWSKATHVLLAKTFVQRGIDATKESRNDFARQCFLQAIAHDTQNEMAWLWLASTSNSAQEKTAHLRKVLEINPENKAARESLDSLHAASENFPPAVEENIIENNTELIFSENLGEPQNDFSVQYIGEETVAEFQSAEYSSQDFNKSQTFDNHAEYKDNLQVYEVEDFSPAKSNGEIALPETDFRAPVQENAPYSFVTEAKNDYLENVVEDFSREITDRPTEEFTWNPNGEVLETAGQPFSQLSACPFCREENEAQALICRACQTMLTLSDLERLLAYKGADQNALQQTIEQMEIEDLQYGCDAYELVNLGIGHINLKNLRKGLSYLQRASHLTPNNLLLDTQVRDLTIRLAEIEERESLQSLQMRGRVIMVIDDSATVRKLISGKLEKSGHEVICAEDGLEALAKLNEIMPDLILLDINMPRMDGYQVCKLIRSNDATKDIPVVMISGKDGFFDKVRGRMSGSTGYITKPFGPETLMKMVETYIAQPVEA